ncbi:hypothetical protein FSARC_5364 [Fusarium sarcochroum]|uniref:Zn(2)-C6 fungal-type domain-containing protein n=1 Tax=Fusarium sarcochroum TaxID=1208366 RepID=A0A8H4TZV3_9HYPO|nr:hypothetical protein FSARC_5364 [Fusarium sarcochroum]
MDTESQDTQSLSPTPRPPRSKRGRLSLACTQCRKRKVRCDATTPKCRNCVLRGDECQTFDPRRPNGPAVRKWPHKNPQSIATLSPIQRRASTSQHSSPSSIIGSHHRASSISLSHSGNKERNPSWIERAYQDTQVTPDDGTDGQTNDSPDVVMNTDESSHRIKVAFISDILRFSELQQAHQSGLQSAITSADAPALATIYTVLSIGMDDHEGAISPSATAYLTGAYSLLSHLLSFPYMSSVQALVLLAIAMRARGKEGQCWHLLGQAIRIGYSIGFHRRVILSNPTGDSPSQVDRQLHSRVWWACYALEKTMQLETGRPSAIEITDCDQPLPDSSSGLSMYFIRWVSLSLIIGKISEHIFQRRAESSYDFLSGISELDQTLVDWLDETPDDAKTGQGTTKSSEERSFTIFLSLQFHQAQITLLRPSLIFLEASFTNEIQKHGPKLQGTTRLLQSQNTCIEAARSIITQIAEFADSQPHFLLLTPTQTFLAAVTLALQTFKKPHKRMGRSDGELVRTASDYVADCYRRVGQHDEFVKGILELSQRVNQVLSGDSVPIDQIPRPSQQELQNTHTDQSGLTPNPFCDTGTEPFAFDPLEYFQDPFQAMPMDHFWAVMEGDFANIGDQGLS